MKVKIMPKSQSLLLLLFVAGIIGSEGQSYYQLTDGIKNIDCDNTLNSYLIYGTQIFQNSNMSTPASVINISGWVFFRGFIGKYYTIVSVHQANNIVFSLSYTLQPQPKMKFSIYSSDQTNDYPFLAQKQWLFFMVQVKYDPASQDLLGEVYIYGKNIKVAFPTLTFNNPNIHFDKNSLSVNIGLPGNSLSLESSCSFTRNLIIVWDFKYFQTYVGGLNHDISDIKTQIIWNYDLFYIKSNQGQLVSSYNQQSKIKSPFIYQEQDSDEVFKTLSPGQVFMTDLINISDVQGLSFGFQIFLTDNILDNVQILTLISENNQIIFRFDKNYHFELITIQDGNVQTQRSLFPFITIKMWTQFYIVVKIGLVQKIFFQIKSDFFQITQKFDTISIQKNAYVQFGSLQNKVGIKLNDIYIVKGSYIKSSPSCTYQLLTNNQCLFCDYTQYQIDFQNNMICADTSTVIYNPTNRTVCAKDQLNIGNQCLCRNQFYKFENQCFMCPTYCNGCVSAYTCKQKDAKRNKEGVCENGYFDDGFKCILSNFTIQNNNLAINYQMPLYNCNLSIADSSFHTFDNNLMRIQQNQSIFYSFSFSLINPPDDYSVVSIVADSGIDIFIILIINNKLHLYILGNDAFSIEFNQSQTTWVGLLTDWSQIQLFFFTEAQLNVKKIAINSAILTTSPSICVGSCHSLTFPKYICANLGERPFILIKDIPLISEKTDIFFLISKPMNKIAQLNCICSNQQPEQIFTLDQNPKILINFQDSLKQTDDLKGFLIDQNTWGQITLDSVYESPITFSTYIFIQKIEKTFLLLSYGNIQYYLVPREDLNSIFVRICVEQNCVDSNYSSLSFNYPNFLLILYRNKSPFTSDYSFIQFEIYCNYKKERVNLIQSGKYSSSISQLILGKQSQLDEASLFLNKISLYSGDGYLYPNYNTLDNCFIFINLSPTECLYPKQKYKLMNGQIITDQECQNLNQSYATEQGYYYVSPFTGECQFRCFIKNATPDQNNNCFCKDGYFLNTDQSGIQQCQKCSSQCKECQNDRDYCLECKNNNLQAPLCQCNQDNQYLDQNNQCQACSQKCKNCEKGTNNCLTCSSGRINPPLCECDQSEYDVRGDQCIKRFCNKRCKKCLEDQTNCTQCNKFRQNPPKCNCLPGYFEDINGDCIKCNNFNQYFDEIQMICLPCKSPCLSCNQIDSSCTSCINGYNLDGNICKCPNGNVSYQSEKGDIHCLLSMDLSHQFEFKQNIYKVTLKFDHTLKQFDIAQKSSKVEIIQIFIPELQAPFDINNYKMNGDTLTFDLTPKSSFLSLQTKLFIKYPQLFMSPDNQYVLTDKYVKNPILFKIGPIVLSQQTEESKAFNSALEALNEKSTFVDIFQKFQLVLYLLNTVQPSALFFLINAQLPPNLYMFLQLFGIFIYPKVQGYQDNSIQTKFQLLGLEIKEQEVSSHCIHTYSKLGFSNSLIINIPIILIKYFIILLLLLIITIIIQINVKTFPIKSLFKMQSFLFSRLNFENEINLLMITLSVLIQFQCIEPSSWFSRNGLYLAVLLKFPQLACTFCAIISFFSSFLTGLKRPYQSKRSNSIKIISESLICFCWILFIFILKFEDKLSQHTVFDQDLVESYLKLGKTVIICLGIFNLLFLIEFFASNFVLLYQKIRKKKE